MKTSHTETGKQKRDKALNQHEQRRKDLLLQARRIFLLHSLEHGSVTADDVRNKLELPAGINPSCLGAVPAPLAHAGIIACNGYVHSVRPASRTRLLNVWRLIDADAARTWLAENPAPVIPTEPRQRTFDGF